MATKLYFHDASNALSGTFPTGEQSAATATVTANNFTTSISATTLRTMNTTKGTTQAEMDVDSLANTSAQNAFCGYFCSPTFDVNQTVGTAGQTVTLNIGNLESNLAMNAADLRCNIYVWRPSTGAVVGTVGDRLAMTGDAEPSAANTFKANNCTTTSTTGVSALAGDVLICEVWMTWTQGSAGANGYSFTYDGTTETATTNTTVSNHAAYLSFSSDTLTFGTPSSSISCSFGQTLATVTRSGIGAVATTGTFSKTLGTVSLTTAGGVKVVGTKNATLAAATLSGAGTAFWTGTFNNTLATVGLTTAGGVLTHGSQANTLATVTKTTAGAVSVTGTKNATLAAATLTGAGTVTTAGAAVGTFNQTLAAATLSGVGTVATTGTKNATLAAATLSGVGTNVTHGTFNQTLATVALSGIGTNATHGALNSTLAAATLSATGLNSTPLTPVVHTTDTGSGSGASRTRTRRKFVIPTEPGFEWSQDKIFGRDEPTPTVPEQIPPTPVRKLSMAEVMTEARPASGPAQLPMPGRVTELDPADEYSDEDMMMLLLLAI